MLHTITSSLLSFGATGILVALFAALMVKRFVKGIITNIIMGGALYIFLDMFHIAHMSWSVTDGIVVALLGIPGTILLALLFRSIKARADSLSFILSQIHCCLL